MSFRKPVVRRTARLALVAASVLVFVMVFAGVVSALTAGNVDGVWGNPTPSNTSSFRWCYAPDNTTGSAGSPGSNCSTSSASIQNPPGSTITDENQFRYGSPAGGGSNNGQRSGYGFNGNNNIGVIAADVPFYLGRFTHYNNPITADNILTGIGLSITVDGLLCDDSSVPTEGGTQVFNYTFTHDETPNDPAGNPGGVCPYGDSTGNGCDDRVTVSQQSDTEFTCPEGLRTVQILGFIDGANCEAAYTPPTVNTFVTGEGQANPACLWARISDPTEPLAVTLASFEATGQADRVVVTWETVSELQNAGFNLYRSENDYEAGERINAELIPSQAPGSAQGFTYQVEDLDVTPGQTYWYTLEDVDLSGGTALHGPVSATVLTPTAVTLSGLDASAPVNTAISGWLVALLLSAMLVGFVAVRRMRTN